MGHELALADRAYSSWSMRIGLLVDRFGLPVAQRFAPLYTDAFGTLMTAFAPARTVPALRTEEGVVVTESLAIAEELASRFPDRGLWPEPPEARAVARGLSAEMYAGFAALRSACPMNLRLAYRDVPVSEAVRADLDRLETIWRMARSRFGDGGPWLCGGYSIADAFYAPVAARIAGYALPVEAGARAYVAAHLGDPAFRRWRAAGLAEDREIALYTLDHPRVPWPGTA